MKTAKELLDAIEQDVGAFENFYPKDIFVWDNKQQLDFTRGRFNQHCFEIVENVRNHIKDKIISAYWKELEK